MNILERLIEELNKLPSGYISEKTIKGNKYYYYQYWENGKKISKYIKKNELEDLKSQIERRREIEKEISRVDNESRDLKLPTKRMRDLTGDLMMEDKCVAKFEKGNLVFIDEKRCPLLIKRTGNLYEFLASRAIDRDRTHSRLLKKYLGIKGADDATVSIFSYGACITDNYWFKAKGSKLKYKDIAFKYDYYSDLVLKGKVGYIPKSPKHSPQLTLQGSFEKCWKLIDNEWYLYKMQSLDESFSELFSSRLAKVLGVPTADFDMDDGFIRTKNIAGEYNMEPISSIAGDDDSFKNVFNAILLISENIAIQYLKLILFDFIIYNVDRHNENCALFRDKASGEIVSLAPNYDNNIALIAATQNLKFNAKKDGMASYLVKFLNSDNNAKRLIKEVKFNKLNEEDIKEILSSIDIKEDEELITKFTLDRYNYVISLINQYMVPKKG